MVAVIKTGHSISRILSYNENKCQQEKAVCLGSYSMPLDADQMSFATKLSCFKKVLELNPNVTRNSVHISLNFHPRESALNAQKLGEIAAEYMDKIGFAGQPFLVYQHNDAGHPHIHIVSIKVRPDGSRIDMQNIGRNQSEQARKEIEEKHGLVRAEDQQSDTLSKLKPVSAERVQYGKTETKNAIQNVLENVLTQYRYASLAELNAVLRLYNVEASNGEMDSRTFLHGGLIYRVIDAEGKPIGVPIKASRFYNSPGLTFLKAKYDRNADERKPFAARIRNAVDQALLNRTVPVEQLAKELEKAGITLVLRRNAEGILYGVTYVDHKTKCVFNGSALGKEYSARRLTERCNSQKSEDSKNSIPALETAHRLRQAPLQPEADQQQSTILGSLLKPEFLPQGFPSQGNRKKRRRRRRPGTHNSQAN